MKRFLLLLSLLSIAAPVFAGEVFLPVVVRAPGAFDTLWRTEIVVSNVTRDPSVGVVPATITFHRNDGQTQELRIPLSPMEVFAVPDALYNWFSAENASGIVRVTWDDPDARLIARARIYNAGPHGEFGQSVPGVATNRLVSDVYLPGLSGVDGNRTNVGVSNPSAYPVLFWIMLYDTAGESHGGFATSVPARGFVQFNDIFSHFQTGPLNAAMIRVSGVDGTVFAYASIVRNDTGDATFVTGE